MGGLTKNLETGQRSWLVEGMPKKTIATEEPVGRAMRAAHQAAKTLPATEIVKPGELVEARYARGSAPSAAARKTLALLIQAAAGDAWKPGPHAMLKRDLRGSHKGNERLDEVFDELQTIVMKIDTVAPDGRAAKLTAPVIAYRIEHLEDDDRSKVWWEFSEPARRAMQGSSYYAALNRGTILAFESRYSVTLYERGCLLVGRRNPSWSGTLEELREVMGVPAGKYSGWADIRRKVIEPAIAENNQLADFVAGYTVTTGSRGKVTRIELWFRPKTPDERNAAASELEFSRVGRKARRSGTVDDVLTPAQRKALEDLRAGRISGDGGDGPLFED